MPCCVIALLAVFGPRFILAMLWIFNNRYLSGVFDNFIVPLLGFLLLPWTTLAYVFAVNSHFVGSALFGLDTTGLILVVIGFLFDLFAHGGGYRSRNRMSYSR